MTESEALAVMVAPGTRRPGKPNGGVIQILVTSVCNLSCFNCTQASNVRRPPWFMTPEQFEMAVLSLRGYFGTVGVFGGCPTVHPQFETLCEILRWHVPKERCGLWANNLMGKGAACRATFSESWSNLNVHLDRAAYDEFRRDWPESRPFGLTEDSRHSPPWVAMKDVLRKLCDDCEGEKRIVFSDGTSQHCDECDGAGSVYDEAEAWRLISRCPINQHWSAGIGVFRGELRAWFCEIAMAQSILHQDEPDYPDTGLPLTNRQGVPMTYEWDSPDGRVSVDRWWQLPMTYFRDQVRKHCHSCGVPLNGYGELAQRPDAEGAEQVSATHAAVYRPKRPGRRVEVVTQLEQLGVGRIQKATDYLGNAKR